MIEILTEYYVYIMAVLLIAIITIIGYLADKRDQKRKAKVDETKKEIKGEVIEPTPVVMPQPIDKSDLTVTNPITNDSNSNNINGDINVVNNEVKTNNQNVNILSNNTNNINNDINNQTNDIKEELKEINNDLWKL